MQLPNCGFAMTALPNFSCLVKSAVEYEMHENGSMDAWLFARSLFWPHRVSSHVFEGSWRSTDANTQKSQLVLFADFFFFSCSVKILNKQRSEKDCEKKLFRESSVTVSRSGVHYAVLALHCCLLKFEGKAVLPGHWDLASDRGGK